MQRCLQSKDKKKPQLIIETLQTNPQSKSFKRKQTFRNQVQIKPPMSAKNRHQLKNAFSFANIGYPTENIPNKQQNRIKTLERLQSQRIELMKSLQILKQGAVSAIVQKQQQIIKLKDQIFTSSAKSIKNQQKQQQNQLNTKLVQKQLQLKQMYRKQLEEQVQELRRQLRKQRIRYESELYEKQQIINSLYVQLDSSYQRIDKLQKDDQLLTQKIRTIELQNTSLLKQLQTSQILGNSQLNNSFFLNISNVTQKTNNRVNSSIQQDVFFLQNPNSGGQRSHRSNAPKRMYSENMIQNQDQDYLSNSVISQRIQVIKQKHKQQIESLKQEYEKRIQMLKQTYGKNINAEEQNQDNDRQLNKNPSSSSLRSFKKTNSNFGEVRNLTRSRSSSYASAKSLLKNQSMQDLKLQQRMHSIQQRGQLDQAGTPRYNLTLKDEILEQQMYPLSRNPHHNRQNLDATTTISSFHNYFNNKNSHHKHLYDDTISQFTSNHFQYPLGGGTLKNKPFLRNNSIATFEGQGDVMVGSKGLVSPLSQYNNIQQICQPSPSDSKLSTPNKQLQCNAQQFQYKPRISKLRLMTKQSFEGQKQQQHVRFNNNIEQSELDQEEKKSNVSSSCSNKSNASKKSTLKKDIMLFCVGLMTGGTLFGLGAKMLNK